MYVYMCSVGKGYLCVYEGGCRRMKRENGELRMDGSDAVGLFGFN